MSGRVRTKGQAVRLGALAQHVANDAGFHIRAAFLWVDGQHPIQVFGGVQHQRHVAGLAGQAGAAAAHEQGRAVAAGGFHRVLDVLDGLGHHDTDGNLAVIGSVG